MIVIAGTIRLDPERRDAAVAAAVEMMKATRKEEGCLAYTFAADLEEPGAFLIFEQWASPEALAAHFQAPHMAAFQAQMGGLGVREVDVSRYEIASIGPVTG